MDPKFQNSFIPKNPVVVSPGQRLSKTYTINIFASIAGVVFVITLLASGVLFAYQRILTNQIASLDGQLVDARAAFQPEKIQELIDANSRVVTAKNLLKKHVVVSEILNLLQSLTVKRLRIDAFTYENRDSGGPTLAMTVETPTYNTLALQQDIFRQSTSVIDPTFSDFTLGDNGIIKSKFFGKIIPVLTSYETVISSGTLVPQVVTPPTPTIAATTTGTTKQ